MKRESRFFQPLITAFSFIGVLFISILPAFSQQPAGTVNGVIADSSGSPIRGASVQVLGSPTGVVSDGRGAFHIKASEGSTLIVSITGYRTEKVEARIGVEMRITLAPLAAVLNDVVVIGYGTQKKADVTGAVASVKAADLADRITANPLEALSGKVAGLSIYSNSGRPGGGVSVNLRGFNSISASNSPLFVIDGIVGADFQSINPSDIEAVDVLKDASSTAIYGSRGANGVIIVTTRKAKNGDFGISYNGSASVNQLARRMDMLDSKGWLSWFKRAWAYDPARGPLPDLHADYPNLFDGNGNPLYNTDWQKEATRTAVSNRHYISLTQGTAKSKNGLYAGYQDDEGILRNTYYKKFSARYNTEMNLRSWFTVGGDIGYNQIRTNRVDDFAVGAENATRMMVEFLPIFPVKYPNGDWSRLDEFGYNFDGAGGHSKAGIYPAENPVRQLDQMVNLYLTDQILANFYGNVRLAKGLTFKSTYSTQILSTKNNLYVGKDLEDIGLPTSGAATVGNSRTVYWQAENYLTYDRNIASNHHINAVLGASWMESTQETSSTSATGFSTDFYQFNNLSAGAVQGTPQSGYSDYKLNSYYGRVNYAYLDKYLLTFTGRYDGSSKFGDKTKFAFFPSGAVGWIISKEDFLADSRFISFLKLRGSYGITGNSEILPYSSLGNVGVYTIALNDQRVKGTGPVSVPNPNLKWEQTAQTDIGVDLRVLDNRLSLTADYYKKKTTNLLLNVPISSVTGYTAVTTNIGSLQNTGFELAVNGDIIRDRDLSWSLGAQLSSNTNKILALGTTNADIYPGPNFLGQTNILQVGKPIGNFWGFQRVGTWSDKEAGEAALYGKKPGDIKRLDVNKDHVFDNSDAMVLGNMFPKYELDLTTTLRYKNWTLSADVQVRHGNKVMNITTLTVEDRQYYANSYGTILKDAWTPDHQNTPVPSLRFANIDPWGTDLPFFMDSRWVEDGSFVRGKSINLGYAFPAKQAVRLGLTGLRLYGNVQNFFLLSRYRGFDPEVSTFGGSFAQGIEFYGSPRPRTYTIGLTANF
ncbi:MAG TPA: TonB-dependent receptor [Puia sp.]|uniref:SusC/RagA family TonB-linked outer membrane protein n=1 Tax=Puia sp. TaxID=2045100 RepID=UPI002C643E57|nr:TonB-dependent receptor [Puia sp.]HVU94460.1 TonB-dependent receptor [Puia sp.]